MELCKRRLDQVTLAGAHNAYATTASGFGEVAQTMPIRAQLDAGVRVLLLESRRANLLTRLREIRGSALNAELDSYARSVMEHAAKAVELDLAWIDDILAQEKNVGNSSAHNIATEAK